MEYLNGVALFQVLFFFYLLYCKKKNILNKILGIIILLPGLNFFSNIINLFDFLPPLTFGILFFTVQATSFLFAPMVFYYVSLMCGKKVKITHPLFIITSIFILFNVYSFIDFSFLTLRDKELYIQYLKLEEFPVAVFASNILFIIMQQVYFTIAAIKVFKFKNEVINVFSNRSNTKLGFISRFVILIWVLNIISIIMYATIPMYLVEFIVLPSVIMVINTFIVYYAFEYQVIFDKDTYSFFLKDLQLLNKKEDLNSTSEAEILYATTITSLLEKEKTYLNPDYTIYDLSKDVAFSQKKVSKVINKELNLTFSTLINQYRIEESKRLLKEKSKTLTIAAIGELSGFKSKTSFYRTFKQLVGIPPSDYIKKQ